jgi:hypothetical protein
MMYITIGRTDLHDNNNVLVADGPEQLGVVATLLQEALEFVTERLSILNS